MTDPMEYRPLTAAEIRAIEAKVDDFFLQQTMPGRTLGEARWKLLTAVEDSLRLGFARKASAWFDPSALEQRTAFVLIMDKYKYSLKHALDLIDRSSLPDTNTEIEYYREDGSEYLQVNRLIHREAALYASAVGTFSSIWSGDKVAYGRPNRDVILTRSNERNIQYHAIEILTARQVDEYTPVPLLAAIFAAYTMRSATTAERIEWGEPIKKIIKSTKVKSKSLHYQFVIAHGKELYNSLDHEPAILPRDWVFPWGAADKCTRFSVGLLSLCFYHIVAVYFGSVKHSLPGAGLNQAGLCLTASEFARRVSAISAINTGDASSIISALTYGNGVRSSDPALQPFIPIGDNLLFVPCMMVMTNQWSRNMLALHARIASKSFDAQSGVFEKEMTLKIMNDSRSYWAIPNKTFTDAGWSEEIDMLYIDIKSKTLLICELKWTIPPGDPREVINRRKALANKMSQVQRKSSGVKARIPTILKQAGVAFSQKDSWSVLDLLVIEGYSGDPSIDPYHTPVVQQVIFSKLLEGNVSIKDIHRVLTTPLWLPREGIDIRIGHKSDKIGDVEINEMGYSVIQDNYLDKNLVRYVKDALMYNLNESGSITW